MPGFRRARVALCLCLAPALVAAAPARRPLYKIALAQPLTGDAAADGQGIRRGVEMAIDRINADPRRSIRLELEAFDDRADPKEAVTVANIIADRRVAGVIGHLTSGCSVPASKVYARAGLPMINPTALNSELTEAQESPDWTWPKTIFRLAPIDRSHALALASHAAGALKARRVAVVHDQTRYGRGLAGEFAAAVKERGAEIVSFDGVSVGDKDFKALLTRIRTHSPDLVFFGGLYAEFGLILRQARELSLKARFMGGTGGKTPSLFDIAGPAAEGTLFSESGTPFEKLAGSAAFLAEYARRHPGVRRTPFDHYGYAAVELLAAALEAAGNDRARMAAEIRSGRHPTLLGTLEFDAKGDNKDQSVSIVRAVYAGRSFEPASLRGAAPSAPAKRRD